MERGRSFLSGRHANVGGGRAVQVEVTKRTFEFCDMSFFCFREYVFVGDIGNMEIMLKSQKLGVEVTTLASVLFVILVVFPTAMLSSKGQASAIVFGHLFEYLGYNSK